MLDVKGFLDSLLQAIHQTCKIFQLIIFNGFKYRMWRFLQFWCKLNTRGIVKTCPFRFPCDQYCDSLDVLFPQFSNYFLPFPMAFPHVSPGVSTISQGDSTVSLQCFPRFLFQILRVRYIKKKLVRLLHLGVKTKRTLLNLKKSQK